MRPKPTLMRISAFLLCFALVAALLPMSVMASAQPTTDWADNADTSWYIGHENDSTYTISDAAQLVNEGNQFSNKTIILGDDINLSGHAWTPIGATATNGTGRWFSGNFDGNGKTISNLSVDITGSGDGTVNAGLFGAISGGSVRDLTLSGSVSATGATVNVGGLAGSVNGASIRNCTVHVEVSGTSNGENGTLYAGGVVGYLSGDGATVAGCAHTDDVTDSTAQNVTRDTVSLCGVVGYNRRTVQDCYNTGAVFLVYYANANTLNIGGVVGQNYGNDATVTRCYNTGSAIYGVVGWNGNGTVEDCYYLEDIEIDNIDGTTYKTAAQFASGQVAWALQDAQTEKDEAGHIIQVWGQTLGTGGDPYPVLTGDTARRVYKLTFQNGEQTVDTRYANSGRLTFPEDPTSEGQVFDGWYHGETKYSATSELTADLTLTARFSVSVTEVTLDKTNLTLEEGDSQPLKATIEPSNATNQNVTWTSSDTNVATVSETGQVTAVKEGTATITVETVDGNKTATCEVTVEAATVSVTEVTLDQSALTLGVEATATLRATVQPDNATDKTVTWASSDTSVATVSGGQVTAVAPGTATITVTTEDGKFTAQCTVTVVPKTAPVEPSDQVGYLVEHYLEGRDGYELEETEIFYGEIGATVTAQPKDYAGYTYNAARSTATGELTEIEGEEDVLILELYYDQRIYVPSQPSRPTEPTGPSTGSSNGWESIQDEILDANDGESIVIDMNGETEVPGEVFEDLAGKDVDVTFDLGDGLSWTVNGTEIPTGTSFDTLDLGVSMGTSGIPVDVFNAITGEVGTVQITLAHDGEFGFTLTLTAPLGRENYGYWANLYHYDEGAERLVFETSSTIDRNGNVSLQFSHASQFAIVIDDHSHDPEAEVPEVDLPFTDVADGTWYYDAVAFVYQNGLMNGTSAVTFAPGLDADRAMVVTILWRLTGSPVVNYLMDFADVSEGAWYAEAVRWAASEGIVEGWDGQFFPGETITREQLAAILYRYAGEPAVTGDYLAGFADADEVADWAQAAMNWAVASGIINGGDSGLDPRAPPRGPSWRSCSCGSARISWDK